jgi:uncharacterized cofD-like protein
MIMANKDVVTIGGGTGSFVLLRGLKNYPLNISAIVSMADDGGSTGVLRDELGVLPPGDVRQCLVALSDSTETMRKLMNYRFESGKLKGHNFGNLLLSALEKIENNFPHAVAEASKILSVKGKVIPVTDRDMRLFVELQNGKILVGQKQLDHNEGVRKFGIKKAFLKPRVKGYGKALQKIEEADYVIIGPGDHFGSIVPNFLVQGVASAVKSSRAKVIYNCNLTNKKGQTENFDLDRYVFEIEKFIGKGRVDFVTFNSRVPEKKLLEKYEKREGRDSLVKFFPESPRRSRVVCADIIQNSFAKKNKNDAISSARSFIRHDSKKLAKVLVDLMEIENNPSVFRRAPQFKKKLFV